MSPLAWLGEGKHGAGPLKVTLHINNSSPAREMGVSLTRDVAGRQLLWLLCLCESSLEMVHSMPSGTTTWTKYGS